MTLAELKNLIDTLLPDNMIGLITEAKIRQAMKAIADFVVSSQGEADTAPFVYDSGFSYDTGDPVIYDAAWYLSLVDTNLNNTPDSSPTEWDPVNAFNTVLSIWEQDAVYLGELTIVIKDNKLYLLDRDSVGSTPYVSSDFAAELANGDWINLLPDTTPVANSYADSATMIAAQGFQVSGYFYFGGATLYVYLGTTVGDISDYYAVGGGSGGIESVGAGTGIEVDVEDPANPVVNLSAAAIASLGKADTAYNLAIPTHREDNAVLFDRPHFTGIKAAARTGNITFDFTGAVEGMWTEMRHADASAFDFDDDGGTITINLLFDVLDIETASDNYFLFTLIDKTVGAEVVQVQLQNIGG